MAVYCLDGIVVYHNSRRDPEDFELMWFIVALKSGKLIIAAVFRPPNCKTSVSYRDSYTHFNMKEYGASLGDQTYM